MYAPLHTTIQESILEALVVTCQQVRLRYYRLRTLALSEIKPFRNAKREKTSVKGTYIYAWHKKLIGFIGSLNKCWWILHWIGNELKTSSYCIWRPTLSGCALCLRGAHHGVHSCKLYKCGAGLHVCTREVHLRFCCYAFIGAILLNCNR